MQEFINRTWSVKTKMYYFCVEEQKGLAFHLEGLCVPLVVRVPQFGNHWFRLMVAIGANIQMMAVIGANI